MRDSRSEPTMVGYVCRPVVKVVSFTRVTIRTNYYIAIRRNGHNASGGSEQCSHGKRTNGPRHKSAYHVTWSTKIIFHYINTVYTFFRNTNFLIM